MRPERRYGEWYRRRRPAGNSLDSITGTVCAVNEELLDQPELLNKAPYDAWLIKVENVTDTEELLDAAAYEAFCTEEG